jgi:hypothetical protein
MLSGAAADRREIGFGWLQNACLVLAGRAGAVAVVRPHAAGCWLQQACAICIYDTTVVTESQQLLSDE